jgi:hypothetical protein
VYIGLLDKAPFGEHFRTKNPPRGAPIRIKKELHQSNAL